MHPQSYRSSAIPLTLNQPLRYLDEWLPGYMDLSSYSEVRLKLRNSEHAILNLQF